MRFTLDFQAQTSETGENHDLDRVPLPSCSNCYTDHLYRTSTTTAAWGTKTKLNLIPNGADSSTGKATRRCVGDLICAYTGIHTSTAGPCQQLVLWLVNKESALINGQARGRGRAFRIPRQETQRQKEGFYHLEWKGNRQHGPLGKRYRRESPQNM